MRVLPTVEAALPACESLTVPTWRRIRPVNTSRISLTTPAAAQRAMNPQTSAIGTPDLNGCSFG